MTDILKQVEQQILTVLEHPESEEGLYFWNFIRLHEEDQRPVVEASYNDVIAALNILVREGRVVLGIVGEEVIFQLNTD